MKHRTSAVPLYLISLLYFLLPFVHIGFALTGVVCMVLPFLLLAKTGKKRWCGAWCPRADYFDLLRRPGLRLKVPALLSSPRFRQTVLSYFCLNLLFIVLSSFMVASGRIDAIDRVRFLIVAEIPVSLPQLLRTPTLPPLLLHLAYRIYSVMFTSFTVGTLMALLYRPRSWCRVCPVNTLSDRLLQSGSATRINPTNP